MDKNQVLTVNGVNSASMTGVKSVDCFTGERIKLTTETGTLTINGQNLKINAFTTGSGNFACTGNISSLIFGGATKSVFGRLFK